MTHSPSSSPWEKQTAPSFPRGENRLNLAPSSSSHLPTENYDPVPWQQSMLPPINRWTRLGGLMIAAALGAAAVLSAVTPYKTTLRSHGIVRPVGELSQIEAKTAGTITQLYVRNNQTVKAGDAIALLDDRQLQTQKSQLQLRIQQTQQQQQQLNTQRQSLDSQILAETDRQNRAIASAEAELHLTRREHQDLQTTSTTAIEEAQANLRSAESALDAAQARVGRFQRLATAGAMSQERLLEVQLEIKQLTEATVIARSQLKRAQVGTNPSAAAVAIATERIAQENAISTATIASLRQEQQALRQQQVQLQQQQTQTEHDLQQIDWQLDQLTIRAPVDGTLFQLSLRNVGQTLAVGETVGQLVPSQTELVIKTQLPAQEINRLKVGQPVQVRLSACPYTDYGTLPGRVSQISPDVIAGSQDATSGISAPTQQLSAAAGTYEITIQPAAPSLESANHQCVLQLGMAGQVNIQIQEETLLKFLLRQAKLSSR